MFALYSLTEMRAWVQTLTGVFHETTSHSYLYVLYSSVWTLRHVWRCGCLDIELKSSVMMVVAWFSYLLKQKLMSSKSNLYAFKFPLQKSATHYQSSSSLFAYS